MQISAAHSNQQQDYSQGTRPALHMPWYNVDIVSLASEALVKVPYWCAVLRKKMCAIHCLCMLPIRHVLPLLQY